MERAVFCVSAAAGVPLVLDSSSPAALEQGLKAADGKVLINSVSGEAKSLRRVLPLAKKYGAAVIGLTWTTRASPTPPKGGWQLPAASATPPGVRAYPMPTSSLIA